MGQTVSVAVSSCHKMVGNDAHTELIHEDNISQPIMAEAAAPKLGLRIFADACGDSDGGAVCARFLNLGSEIMAVELEKVKGWDSLRARFERSAKERAGVLYSRGPNASQINAAPKHQWPEGYRFNAARRFWRAKIISQDSTGGFEEHTCMLTIAESPQDRTRANVELDLKDAKDAASYASRFNKSLQKSFGESQGVPGVQVCGPVGCEVIKSSNSQFASPGDVITITPYPFEDVKKFLFDGSEDFLEVPQAFFHHAAWLSNSNEMVCDSRFGGR
jgi:hypothetical protein